MAKKGFRLWQCVDCRERSWHHWIERNRAARMRCPACGCTRLEIVTHEGYQELVQGQRNVVDPLEHVIVAAPTRKPDKIS
jgi:hypothetical protein